MPGPAPVSVEDTTTKYGTRAAETTTTTTSSGQRQQQGQHPLPALPPAPGDDDPNLRIDISSGQGSIALDHLGPLVVNKDGTMSRISNWDKMAPIERENTLRILCKRNQVRLGDLRGKANHAEGDGRRGAAAAEGQEQKK